MAARSGPSSELPRASPPIPEAGRVRRRLGPRSPTAQKERPRSASSSLVELRRRSPSDSQPSRSCGLSGRRERQARRPTGSASTATRRSTSLKHRLFSDVPIYPTARRLKLRTRSPTGSKQLPHERPDGAGASPGPDVPSSRGRGPGRRHRSWPSRTPQGAARGRPRGDRRIERPDDQAGPALDPTHARCASGSRTRSRASTPPARRRSPGDLRREGRGLPRRDVHPAARPSATVKGYERRHNRPLQYHVDGRSSARRAFDDTPPFELPERGSRRRATAPARHAARTSSRPPTSSAATRAAR